MAGPGRRGGGRSAAMAGGQDAGVGLVDTAAARPGPPGARPQGHQVPPLHRRREGGRPAQPRGADEAAAARLPRHHRPRAAHVPRPRERER